MIYDTNLEQCAEVCNLGLTKVMEHCYTYAVQGLVTYTYALNCRLWQSLKVTWYCAFSDPSDAQFKEHLQGQKSKRRQSFDTRCHLVVNICIKLNFFSFPYSHRR